MVITYTFHTEAWQAAIFRRTRDDSHSGRSLRLAPKLQVLPVILTYFCTELTPSAKIIKAPVRKLAAQEWERRKAKALPARL